MTKPNEDEQRFAGYLRHLLNQADRGAARAAMAHLRRGLGKQPGVVYEMDRYVLSQLPPGCPPWQESAYYSVAALFAHWHQGKDQVVPWPDAQSHAASLGRSLRLLVNCEDAAGREEAEKRNQKRLNAILNADSEELPNHLRRVVSLLKARDVPVNWAQLLHDIQHWGSDSRYVQHEWARGFWIQEKDVGKNE